jgi:hypothetical protein
LADEVDQKQLAEQLLAQVNEQGVELMGPNGLLNQLTKKVSETALDGGCARKSTAVLVTKLDERGKIRQSLAEAGERALAPLAALGVVMC